MPCVEDWLNNPLGTIQTLFENTKDHDSIKVKTYFSDKLSTEQSISWVPSLNDTPLHLLKANSLVRFRCMIQDMYDPEFYLGRYLVRDKSSNETWMKSGKYKDIAECGVNQEIDVNSERNVTLDRMTLYCIPVPGETEWVKKRHFDLSNTKTTSMASSSKIPPRNKRGRDEDGGTAVDDASNGMDEGASPSTPGDQTGSEDTAQQATKVQHTQRNPSQTPGTSAQVPDMNFPLPNETGPACLVKIYEDTDSFKVNDIVEFIGVLSVDPSLAQFNSNRDSSNGDGDGCEMMEECSEESMAHCPPPSLVPRLHAVLCNKLEHVNPLVPQPSTNNFNEALKSLESSKLDLHSCILSTLQHATCGDSVAAQYLFCHIVSTVYARADVLPIGKFSLNLSNSPRSPYGSLLHHLISNLVTQSHLLEMTIESLNSQNFSPCKDYTANRLRTGVLQLASCTNLVVDETTLNPGQLDVNGVKNVTALGNLIRWQKVEYDFSYHKQDFHGNIPILILSEGKSMLPSDCLVQMKSSNTIEDLRQYFTQLDPVLTEDCLTKMRVYIGLSRYMEYTVPQDLQKIMQDDFVELRKQDPNSMTVDDFHALLSLTRLLALTKLESEPTVDTWKTAKMLEKERKTRLSQK